MLREGKDVAIIADGLMVWEALAATEELQKDGISASVVDMHTIKPIDEKLVASLAEKTGAIVTAEEHQVWGGLGAAVAQAAARTWPVPVESVGVQDTYAESGPPDALLKKYGLTASRIVEAARRAIQRK